MVGPRLVALETIREDRLLWAATEPLPQYCAGVGVFVFAVRWPLTGKDAGNMEARGREYRGWRWGACFDKVGGQTSANGGVSKVPLYCQKFTFDTVLGVVQLYPSPLHVVQLDLVRPVAVYVSDNPRVFEVDQSIIDEKAASQ